MATRKMTFTIPDSVADRFLSAVRSDRRSRFVAEALRRELEARERRVIEACDVVNADSRINAVIDDWQAVNDPIEEPWDDAQTG